MLSEVGGGKHVQRHSGSSRGRSGVIRRPLFARHFEAEVTAVWPARHSTFETISGAQTRYDLVAGAEEESAA
jgi:hypothetical protein